MKPNVVVIVMDTARWQDVVPPTSDGEPVAPTLASIADEGVRFDNTFAPAPWTLPSHASLFTSTYPSKHGAHAGHERLEDDLVVLPEVFQRADYETVAVSNNTWISEEFGFGRGFEAFHKTWQYVQSDTDLGQVARTEEGIDRLRSLLPKLFEGNPAVNVANAIYGQFFRKSEDSGARRTNEWIDEWLTERDTDRPFFLFVNYLEPHLEYRPPAEYARPFLPDGATYREAMAVSQDAWAYVAGKTEMSDRDFELLRALYRGEIAYLDERIGQLRDALEARGEWQDTVFVVTSDHGENVGEHGLMDHQYNLYDTVLRVPLVVRGGPFEAGRVDDRLVSLTDIAPTLLDVADLEAPTLREAAQGRSLLSNATTDRNRIFSEYLAPQPSMAALEKRIGELPEDVFRYDRSLRAVRTADWKLIRGSNGTCECYHVTDDPVESSDRSCDESEHCEGLEDSLDEWIASFDHADAEGDVAMSDRARQRLEELGYLQE